MEYFSKIHPSGTPHKSKWEEVPNEDLHEDGELEGAQIAEKILKMIIEGDWVLLRRVE